MSVYQFTAPLINGEKKSLGDYEGKVLLIVNTATKCGFTPQLRELQQLYDKYKEQNFVVLGFPCNQFMNQAPGSAEKIAKECQLTHGVTFPLFKKIAVKGKKAHLLYQYLTNEQKGVLTPGIKWNFTKFLIDKKGQVRERYAPITPPFEIENDIQELLKE